MTARSEAPAGSARGDGMFHPWVVAGIFLLFVLAVVNTASFWIDELGTVAKAGLPTLGSWWHEISTNRETEIQMPFYSIYIWGMAKWVGVGEWSLRFWSAVWLIPGLTVFVLGFPTTKRRWAALAVVVTNAFLWYYGNEARSYAMQLGGACTVFGAIQRLAGPRMAEREEGRWLLVFAAGLVILCGSSMLCMIWAGGGLMALWALVPGERLLGWWRRGRGGWILLAVFLAVLGCFYVWTALTGARGSGTGTTDWRTTLFVIYDQCGFSGLGPPRTGLRAEGAGALKPYAAQLGAYAVALGILLPAAAWSLWKKSPRQTLGVVAAIAAPWIFLSLVGVVTHFRLLGRHCAPLAPVWFFLIATGVAAFLEDSHWFGRGCVFVFLGLSVYSSLSIRFDYRQAKDDYRRAAGLGNAALSRHEGVWWNANEYGAKYYRLPITAGGTNSESARYVYNPALAEVESWKEPDVIITSKPDLYDQTGAVRDYIARHHFRLAASFPAFTLWKSPQTR